MPDNDDKRTQGSWIERARAAAPTLPAHGPETTAAAALGGARNDGWDPWEVWLRYIETPRRRLAEQTTTAMNLE